MSYESTAKEVVETMFCKGCEINCFEDDKCVWLTIKESLEKQIPKKPEYIFRIDEDGNKIYYYACPSCGNAVRLVNYDLKVCGCGQKLV